MPKPDRRRQPSAIPPRYAITSGRAFWLLILLLVIGHGACLTWGLPNLFWDWGLDTIDGQNVLNIYHDRFVTGGIETYPPLHGRLVTLAWVPVRWLLFGETPIVGPERMEVANTSAILTGRVISLLMLVAMLIAIRRLGRLLWSDWTGVAAAAAVGLSVPFAYYGHTSNREVPYLCWYAWALVFLLQAVRTGRLRDYLLMSLMISLSFGTKDQAGGFLPLTGLYVLGVLFVRNRQEGRPGWQALSDVRLWWTVVVLVGVFEVNWGLSAMLRLFLPPAASDFPGTVVGPLASGVMEDWWTRLVLANGQCVDDFRRHLGGLFGSSFDAYQQFQNSFAGRLRLFGYLGVLCQQAMGWPMLALAAGGTVLTAVRWREQRGLAVLWVPTFSYIFCFVMIVLVVWLRWAMPLVMVLGLMAGRFITWLPERWPRWRWLWAGLGGLLLVWQVWYAGSVWIASLYDARYQAETWIATNIGASPARPGEGPTVARYAGETYLPRFFGQGYTVLGRDDVKPTVPALREQRPDYVILVFRSDLLPPRHMGLPPSANPFCRKLAAGRLVDESLRYRPAAESCPPALSWPAWRIPTLGFRIVIVERVDQGAVQE